MPDLDVSAINNGWQAVAFVASVTVVVLGYIAMQRAKTGADKQVDANKEVAARVAEVPRLLETVELLTAQAKANAARIEALEVDLTDHRDYVAHLEAMDEFTDPPFPSLERFRQERAK